MIVKPVHGVEFRDIGLVSVWLTLQNVICIFLAGYVVFWFKARLRFDTSTPNTVTIRQAKSYYESVRESRVPLSPRNPGGLEPNEAGMPGGVGDRVFRTVSSLFAQLSQNSQEGPSFTGRYGSLREAELTSERSGEGYGVTTRTFLDHA